MWELDELKAKWAEQDQKLDQILNLNLRLLATSNLNKARSALKRLTVSLGLEAMAWFALVAWFGRLLYEHWGSTQLVVLTALCDVYAIGMLAGTIGVIAATQIIDYGKPVAQIQRQLEDLQVRRIKVTKWGVLTGIVVWAPFMVVTMKALLGIEITNMPWLITNVLFGLILALIAYWLSRKFGEKMARRPFVQRMMQDINGQSLAAARGFLKELEGWAPQGGNNGEAMNN